MCPKPKKWFWVPSPVHNRLNCITRQLIHRVATFKLLGVHLSSDFKWSSHIEAICNKAARRIYFLKQLKRAGLQSNHLLHFYQTVLRPVLEYAAPAWHHGLTKSQCEKLEAVQRRALRIIFPCTHGMPYNFALSYAGIQSLSARRDQLSKVF